MAVLERKGLNLHFMKRMVIHLRDLELVKNSEDRLLNFKHIKAVCACIKEYKI